MLQWVVSRISVEFFFCVRVLKKFVEKPFSAVFPKTSGSEKVYGSEEESGGKTRFSIKNFCLTVPKFSVGESFSASFFSSMEEVWMRGGGSIKIFRRKVFVSQSRKTSYKKLSVFH